jgi:hypothetical protein
MSQGKITEGHSRPLLMLADRPEEQHVLFKDIMLRKLTVRDAEKISRKIAIDKVRKTNLLPDAELLEIEHGIGTVLGTRVNIAKKEEGGRIQIDFFNQEDLQNIVALLLKKGQMPAMPQVAPAANTIPTVAPTMIASISTPESTPSEVAESPLQISPQELIQESIAEQTDAPIIEQIEEEKFADQQVTIETPSYSDEDDEDLYSVKGFSL